MASILQGNIQIIRKLSGLTQPVFIRLFSNISIDKQKSYEAARADPSDLYLDELSTLSGVSIKDLKNKKLTKNDLKALPKKSELLEMVKKVENEESGGVNKNDTIPVKGDLNLILKDILERLIRSEATNQVYETYIANLLSVSKTDVPKITEEIRSAVKLATNRLFDELQKKQE